MKHYTITCSEEQLLLIANMVEDCTRFLSGQCELWNSTILLDNGKELREYLNRVVKPMVTPELHLNESYAWDGGHCPNDYQRKAIAMGYGLYREILHFFAVERTKNNPDAGWNTYCSPTLTCPEQGGLITIKETEE